MIKIKDIDLSFGEKQIFSNLSITINRGEKVLLKAPSGKGKSSLLKILMGFIVPDSGDVQIADKCLCSQNIKEIRSRIAYLPQELSFPKMKVEEFIKNVLDYESNRAIPYQVKEIGKMLDSLSLPQDILSQDTTLLSGGEKQRVGILIMQLLNREIFLLDEITSALNIELKEFIASYFLKMDKTIIVVSHDEVWQQNDLRIVEW